jgi:hypothetical protein
MEQSNFKDSFQKHLNSFTKIIEGYPDKEKVRTDLEELKLSAANDNEMTYRQKDAIIGRADNYLKGQYGEQIKRIDSRSDYSKNLK